ncbi:hypothetical protein LTR28_003320 [Elasticomyces elasticus]|nr:hypothetical protein LTR28_003320 [Elasticomyces elasticus]
MHDASRKIFIKPLPRNLLDESCCKTHMDGQSELAKCGQDLLYNTLRWRRPRVTLASPSDMGLLPKTMDWSARRGIVRQFIEKQPLSSQIIYSVIKEPYSHAELRLTRLDAIYRWLRGCLLYGYWYEPSLSLRSDFFKDNFGKLAAVHVQ